MAEVWGIPEVNEWWVPDEGTCPPVVRSVRSFMENRLPQAEGESRSEDQRNIKGIFSQLSFHESPQAGLKQASSSETPSFFEPMSLSGEDQASQSLAGNAADPDSNQDMDSDNSMLDQSRESFYNMVHSRI